MTTVATVPNAAQHSETPATICAIHQPNFLPRLSTLAKLYFADCWVVLGDVQFVRNDYQHRARIANLGETDREFWLTLPVHRPQGRASLIRDVAIAEPARTRRHVEHALQHAYGRSRHWKSLRSALEPALTLITSGGDLQDVDEASTRALLDLMDWPGSIIRSDSYKPRNDRSARLADLTLATGCRTYLCGTGGSRYLDEQILIDAGLSVKHFATPEPARDSLWSGARRLSALNALAIYGPTEIRRILGRTSAEFWAQDPTCRAY